jgi:hypothetical protein
VPPSRASLLARAALRFTILLLGIASATTIGAVVLGLAFGTSVNRAVSLGFYCVGSFLLLGGFFFGNRGPARLSDGVGEESVRGRRNVYWASREERIQAINESAIFISLGLILIVIGVLVDARMRLL